VQIDAHETARRLVDQAAVSGVSAEEQRRLGAHLAECEECSRYAELSRRAARALDGFAFEVDPAAALRVQVAVQSSAARMASAEARFRRLAAGIAAAMLLSIAGSLVVWQGAAWLAGRWNLPAPAWPFVVVFWFLPSVLLGILPFLRWKLRGDEIDGGPTL
jgi:hypothetical protein